MAKFCPKCGAKNLSNAKFCKNCGYNFSQRTDYVEQDKITSSSTRSSRSDLRENKKSKLIYITLIFIVVILILIVSWLFISTTKNTKNSTTSKSPTSETSSSLLSSSSTNSQLTFGNHPKQDAASIIYYAKENALTVGKDQSSSYIVRLDSSDDVVNQLSEPGQGMAYEVYINENRSDGGAFLIYTVDKDNTINIYSLDSVETNRTYHPSKRISGNSIDNYLNNHNDYGEVNNIANVINIEHEN